MENIVAPINSCILVKSSRSTSTSSRQSSKLLQDVQERNKFVSKAKWNVKGHHAVKGLSYSLRKENKYLHQEILSSLPNMQKSPLFLEVRHNLEQEGHFPRHISGYGCTSVHCVKESSE